MTEGTGWEDDAPAIDAGEPDLQLYYGSLPEFIREFFVKMFPRDVQYAPGLTWCPEWWQHPEATYRLESLWRSWEHLRLDPALGSSTWLREHLDHHLPILLADSGPFKGCSIEKGHSADRDYVFEIVEPPEDLFVAENG